jgi:methionyl-tRNA formyltransferase
MATNKNTNMKIVFLGSSEFSVHVLEELKLHKILPELIVTTPDKTKGRKLILTPTPVKLWAKENKIEVIEPVSLNPSTSSGQEIISKLISNNYDLFLVASYGKIIPREIFEIPKHKTLNIHPSLLPKYRGASPIQSQILADEKEVGVTIMQINEKMDEGGIVAQKPSPLTACNPIIPNENNSPGLFVSTSRSVSVFPDLMLREVQKRTELEKILAIEGARLFAHILPEWLIGAIDPIMQNEKEATYCAKIKKEDGLLDIDLNDLTKNARTNLLKIKAFEDWPTAYFFLNEKRIIITDAKIQDNKLVIITVKPEGKSEMPFADFLRGLK